MVYVNKIQYTEHDWDEWNKYRDLIEDGIAPHNIQHEYERRRREAAQEKERIHKEQCENHLASPAMQMSLTEIAAIWETKFGDVWVKQDEISKDAGFNLMFVRMQRRAWFEHDEFTNSYRLIPQELRR